MSTINVILACVLLGLMPIVSAQRRVHDWNLPSQTWIYPPPSATPSTFITIATQQPQGLYQAESSVIPSQIESAAPPQSFPTGGGETNQPGEPVATGVPSATGSPPTSQSSAPHSTNGTSDNTPAKGVIYKYPDTSSQAVSLAPAWACNWDSTPGVSNPPFQYVPQMWGPGHTLPDLSGTDYVLFYNEPDECQPGAGGSCVSQTDTVSQFQSTFLPATSGKKVSTPCVTNGASGVSFLQAFLGKVGGSTVDIVCFHWYGDDLGSLQSTVSTFKQIQQQYSIPEIWISEMGVNSKPTDVSQYTQYLDSAVDRYAYNLFYLGAGGTL